MVKNDRAYADWEAREARKREREMYRDYEPMPTMDDFRGWGKDEPVTFSVNQTSRRAGKSRAAEEANKYETIKLNNGASFTYVVFDEASKLSPSETLDQKPVFDPLGAYAHAERHSGKRMTSSQKRKVFAAEQARHERRMKEWEDRMTEQELEALEIEVNRSSLGFGGW